MILGSPHQQLGTTAGHETGIKSNAKRFEADKELSLDAGLDLTEINEGITCYVLFREQIHAGLSKGVSNG